MLDYNYHDLISSPFTIAVTLVNNPKCFISYRYYNDSRKLEKHHIIPQSYVKGIENDRLRDLVSNQVPIECDKLEHVILHLSAMREMPNHIIRYAPDDINQMLWGNLCAPSYLVSNYVVRYLDGGVPYSPKLRQYNELTDAIRNTYMFRTICEWTYEESLRLRPDTLQVPPRIRNTNKRILSRLERAVDWFKE